MKYKVLTLTPPWGTLIAIGVKQIETRDWAVHYRGPLLIHQGTNLKPIGGEQGLIEICGSDPFFGVLHDAGYRGGKPLPMGKIVAVCELKAIARIDHYEPWPDDNDLQPRGPFLNFGSRGEPLPDEPELSFGNYAPGRYAWLLADIRALPTPIAARGLPGLWEWEGDIGL